MSENEVDVGRRRFLTATTSVIGGAGVVAAAVPFVSSMLPSARAKAIGAPVKADISKIEPGQMLRTIWRGKTIFILRRTEENLSDLAKMDSILADPASERVTQQPDYAKNPTRSIKEEYLVVIGLCTHLGCSPTYKPEKNSVEAGWNGGFFCPCHGSKFDLAGRVFAGVPAPTNLEVPPYKYLDDSTVIIGEDPEVA